MLRDTGWTFTVACDAYKFHDDTDFRHLPEEITAELKDAKTTYSTTKCIADFAEYVGVLLTPGSAYKDVGRRMKQKRLNRLRKEDELYDKRTMCLKASGHEVGNWNGSHPVQAGSPGLGKKR